MGGMRGASTALSLCVLALLATGATAGAQTQPTPRPTAPPLPSGIGREAVDSIAVSPAYLRTGVVVAMSHATSCSQDCVHLWVTHNRGASWSRVDPAGWQHGFPRITVDGGGREVLVAAGSSAAQRSDDLGATWHDLPAPGEPSASPRFAEDQIVAVAGGTAGDHVLTGGSVRVVSGSGGRDSDVFFAMSPQFPAAGRFAPVLLGASDSHATPLVLTCTADFTCSGTPVVLGSPGAFQGPPSLALSTAYPDDGVAFALVESGVSKSNNGGATFKPLVLPVPPAQATGTTALSLMPGYRESPGQQTLYVSVQQIAGSGASSHSAGDVYRSDDGGVSWRRFGPPGPLDGGATAVAAAPDGRVFAGYFSLGPGGTQEGLLCGDGATWQALCGTAGAAGSGTKSGATVPGCNGSVACTTPAAVAPAGAASGAGAGPATAGGGGGGRVELDARSAQETGAGGGSRGVWRYPVAAVALLLLAIALLQQWRRRRGRDA